MRYHRNKRVLKKIIEQIVQVGRQQFSLKNNRNERQTYQMSFGPWIDYIRNAEKTSFISGKLRRIHYKMTDGAEMIEEYSMDTGILVKRGWKKKLDVLCTASADDMNSAHYNWDIELGEKIQPLKNSEFLVKESISEVSSDQIDSIRFCPGCEFVDSVVAEY